MSYTCFVTNCYFVHLRSRSTTDSQSVTELPAGHECTVIENSDDWWHVKTEVNKVPLQGHIRKKYLSLQQIYIGDANSITEAHLSHNRPEIKPNYDGGRAHPIGDAARPKRTLSSKASKVASIRDIINYLDVEHSVRHKKQGRSTYYNVYAHDFCYLCRVYLPRVWWTGGSLIKLAQGQTVEVKYGKSVREIVTNDLFHWFKDFGADFGWYRVFTAQELQDSADKGKVGIIVVNTTDNDRSGHICAVVPQTNFCKPVRTEGTITTPVMSQAGSTNKAYFKTK